MEKTTTAHAPETEGQSGQARSWSTGSLRQPCVETIGTLLGWFSAAQAARLIEQKHLLDVPPLPELYALIEQTAEYCELLPPPTPRAGATTTIALMPDVEDELMQRPTFVREYAPYSDFRVCLVPLHLLITPQWYINLDFVEHLRQHAPRLEDLRGAIQFAFTEGAELDDFWLSGSALAISTNSIGQPRIHHVEGRRIGPHEIEAVVRVRSRPNYLEVAKVGSRLVMVNGVHRAAALMQAGFDRTPCLLSQYESVAEVIPQTTLGIVPEARLLGDDRPPYLADYFDPQAAPRFRQRSVYTVVRITPQVDTMYVPER
jgi:hypothetical protein